MEYIKIRGARQHNLKNIDLAIPKNQLVVFTGLSGSGKSSLAFDTIYAEGQRRYVESLSSYARQFLGVMDKPDVDGIEGLSPAISIDQKSTSHNPRSTVGTVTEIYDYIRLLFARIGHPHCPNCNREIARQSPEQIKDAIFSTLENLLNENNEKYVRFMILSPVVRDKKGEFSGLLDNLSAKGYQSIRIDGQLMPITSDFVLIKTNKHSIDAVIDRFSVDKTQLRDELVFSQLKTRLSQGIEQALLLSSGLLIFSHVTDSSLDFPDAPKQMEDHLYSELFSCPVCNISIAEIEPRTFSFNSPHGACPVCTGIGSVLTVDEDMIINPHLSISEGGILPFAKMFLNDTWYSRIVRFVARKYDISQTRPLSKLTDEQKHILLRGTGNEIHTIEGKNRFGEITTIEETYPGIIFEITRRYKETDSDFMRQEIERYMRRETCPSCNGTRLKKESLAVTIDGSSIVEITALSINRAIEWFSTLFKKLSDREQTISTLILREIRARLSFLESVGLTYLTLDRSATTLSGGEAQRIRLTSQIGSGLSGVIYVLDEPSIGLHSRDNMRLIETLKKLRDLNNTILVVEHDREVMEHADFLIEFGPGAGKHGGAIIGTGTRDDIIKNPQTVTGTYLSDRKKITRQKSLKDSRRAKHFLVLKNCSENNLKNIDVSIPLGQLVAVTGVSGSGKSTLVVETLYHVLAHQFNVFHREKPGKLQDVEGLEHLDKVILIDQSPIGRTPRSNPATYTGAFTHIRDLYSALPEAKTRGFEPGRFSFNVKGGRCEACQGEGQIKIEMQFLADVYVMCEVCHGARYNSETLTVMYKNKTIADVLAMPVEEALEFFHAIPQLSEKLQTLNEVGLSYMELGQSAPTLSGGEAQRVKLATELSKRATGKTLYILDEPTTGLHFADLEKLLHVLSRLVALGNTVVVIEHNLDIIKNADHIIDLGPEGGDAGGEIIATGSPWEVAQIKTSYTGMFLKDIL